MDRPVNIDDDVSALRAVPLFESLSDRQLKLLAFTSRRLDYAAGQQLFNSGDVSDSVYVIFEGKAEVIVHGANGPVSVAEYGRNALIGEMGVLTGAARSASIVCLEPTSVLRIEKDTFVAMLEEFPRLAIAIIRELAVRLERTNRRL
jgi:CRP-like cAMP-binding protein